MARPNKNNAEYFSHDNSMRNHRKIKALRQKYSADGYSVYSMLLETLTGSNNFEIKLNKELDFITLAGDFGIETERLKEIISFIEELELIQNNNGVIKCESLNERMQPLIDKRVKSKELASSATRDKKGRFLGVGSYGISETETPQSKVKEIKVKEIKVNHYRLENKNTISDFMNNPNSQQRVCLFEFLSSKGFDKETTKDEMLKFITYWSELNSSGAKQRWELEKTFELSKRLVLWFSRIKDFNKANKITII